MSNKQGSKQCAAKKVLTERANADLKKVAMAVLGDRFKIVPNAIICCDQSKVDSRADRDFRRKRGSTQIATPGFRALVSKKKSGELHVKAYVALGYELTQFESLLASQCHVKTPFTENSIDSVERIMLSNHPSKISSLSGSTSRRSRKRSGTHHAHVPRARRHLSSPDRAPKRLALAS